MTKTLKLLLFLNPDLAHLKDICVYLYEDESPHNLHKTEGIIVTARRNGWNIKKSGPYYTLGDQHYILIQSLDFENTDKIRGTSIKLTPDNVRYFLAQKVNSNLKVTE